MKAETRRKKYLTYSIPKLKKIADEVFSLYIRTFYAMNGLVPCFTCDRLFPIKEIDAGHYVSRTCGTLRYEPRNVHPQCVHCNRFCEGKKDIYALRLINKYGSGILEELNKWKNIPPTTTRREDLIEVIDVCDNLEGVQESVPEGYTLEEGVCTQIPEEPTDVCENLEGIQESVPEGYELNEGQCTEIEEPPTEEPPTQEPQEPVDVCPNLGGIQETMVEGCIPQGPTGFAGCPGDCVDLNPPWAIQPTPPTPPVETPPTTCTAILDTYMRKNMVNNPIKVMILQTFLNFDLGLSLDINGIFDQSTDEAVREFQLKYSEEVLKPWGITSPTGYLYKTTLRWINMLSCQTLNLPMPELN